MDQFYKGYIRTKNKEAAQKFKGATTADLLTLEQARAFDEYAGILADDTILIDIDDHAESEILMDIVEEKQLNCRVYQTTRGRHFLFKNNGVEKCGTGRALAIGLHADIKIGSKASYEVIKFAGEERFIEWPEDGEAAALPIWLRPVSSAPNFATMTEGDGRNQTLFAYILKLQSENFTIEDARETLRIVNAHVLKTSVPERELETIIRDESFSKPTFFVKGIFQFDAFARYLKSNNHIKKINGQLHIYQNGVYVAGSAGIESAMIRYIPTLKSAQRTEVLRYLEILIEDEPPVNNAHLIAFNNGIYDLSTDALLPFSPDVVITNKIPHDYNAEAYDKLSDQTLDKLACDDPQIRAILEECVGCCMYRSNNIAGGKAFILTGDKANGKSTFLECYIENVLGAANCTALDLSEVADRFNTAAVAGKLANVGDDISDEFLQGKYVATFKKIVTGQAVKGEFKGQDVFFFVPTVKLLFSANTIPRMRDRTGAVIRRLVIVPFRQKFSKADPDFDPFIKTKLTTEAAAQYIAALGIKGLKRILTENAFTECAAAQAELNGYEEENNPIKAFLDEFGEENVENEEVTIVYRKYSVFCAENQTQPLSKIGFSRNICKRLELQTTQKRIGNERINVFERGTNA